MTKNHWVVTNNQYLEMIQGVKVLASCIKRPFQALIITQQSVLLRNHQKLSMHKETISKELGLSRFQENTIHKTWKLRSKLEKPNPNPPFNEADLRCNPAGTGVAFVNNNQRTTQKQKSWNCYCPIGFHNTCPLVRKYSCATRSYTSFWVMRFLCQKKIWVFSVLYTKRCLWCVIPQSRRIEQRKLKKAW
jgi:hypothetical protein